MRGRSNCQQVNDHGFVESGEPVIDIPGPLRRPMPIKSIALRRAAVPVPLHGLPKMRDSGEQIALTLARAIEVLPCSEQALHQECGLDQVSAVIKHVEYRQSLAALAVHEMRPSSVVARSFFQETHDFGQALKTLIATDEAAIYSNN